MTDQEIPSPGPKQPIRLRSAESGDAPALAALHVRTWQEAYESLMPEAYLRSLDPTQRLPMWTGILSRSDVTVFVAEHEGLPVGFSCGGRSNDPDAPPTTGELWSIYLLRKFWGQGAGKLLHDRLLVRLGDRGFGEATLWVLESNDRTRKWYSRQGWEADGSMKTVELWGAQLTEVRYRKDLNEPTGQGASRAG